jgi:ABC-type amino acid transport substrate-binding protein
MRLSFVTLMCLWLGVSPGMTAEPIRVLAEESKLFAKTGDGGASGFEYYLLRTFAEREGRELEIVWVAPFDEILERIENGQGDVAAAQITVTEERKKRFDFTDWYLPVRIVLVEGADRDTHSLAQLAGQTVATLKDSTFEKLLVNVPGLEFLYVDSSREMFAAIVAGRAVAAAADSVDAIGYLEEYPTLRIGIELTEAHYLAFALPRGSSLTRKLSDHIGFLKESGLYYQKLHHHLGARAAEIFHAGTGAQQPDDR